MQRRGTKGEERTRGGGAGLGEGRSSRMRATCTTMVFTSSTNIGHVRLVSLRHLGHTPKDKCACHGNGQNKTASATPMRIHSHSHRHYHLDFLFLLAVHKLCTWPWPCHYHAITMRTPPRRRYQGHSHTRAVVKCKLCAYKTPTKLKLPLRVRSGGGFQDTTRDRDQSIRAYYSYRHLLG
jgi:hypothetical protein